MSDNLADRVARIEQQFNRLCDALAVEPATTIDYQQMRCNPTPAPDCPHRRVDRDASGATVCLDCQEDISRG